MEQERKIRIAITQGDTNGVGYEVILKTFSDPTMLELCTPIVYGSPKVAAYHSKVLDLDVPYIIIKNVKEAREGKLNMLSVIDDDTKIDLGMATPESAEAAKKALDKALEDYKAGGFDVLVTAPVSKNSIKGFNGHTNYIENALGDRKKGLTILTNDDLRVALVTNNVSIKDVAESITKQKIMEKATIFYNALRRDLRVSNPRIAVLALNPRCGEDGVLGDEEQTIINPAIKELSEQGMTPFKAVAYENGVRFTAGLELIRTAPAHGVNFAAAGQNVTDEQSLRNAIYVATDVWRNRQNYDEPYANPLPKLYHERRDESEKVRFRTPADGEVHNKVKQS